MIAEKVIKEHLKNNGIKLTFLSEKAGIPKDYLSKSLNGNRNLKGDELIAVCNVLGLDLSDFKEGQ